MTRYLAVYKDEFNSPRAWGISKERAKAVNRARVELDRYRMEKAGEGQPVPRADYMLSVTELPLPPSEGGDHGDEVVLPT